MSDSAELLRVAARRDEQGRDADADFLRMMALYFKRYLDGKPTPPDSRRSPA